MNFVLLSRSRDAAASRGQRQLYRQERAHGTVSGSGQSSRRCGQNTARQRDQYRLILSTCQFLPVCLFCNCSRTTRKIKWNHVLKSNLEFIFNNNKSQRWDLALNEICKKNQRGSQIMFWVYEDLAIDFKAFCQNLRFLDFCEFFSDFQIFSELSFGFY